MKLFTKQNETKLQKQYPKGSDMDNQDVVCKIFDPTGSWTWYIMNQDPNNPDYLWGIVKGFEVEMGSISKAELENLRGKFNMPMERDKYFSPINAKEVWEKLMRGEHV
jgi:hypothetical protein